MDVERKRPLVSDRIMMEERSIAAVSTPPTVTGDYEIDRQRHVRAFQERLPGEVEKMTWPLDRIGSVAIPRPCFRLPVRHKRAGCGLHHGCCSVVASRSPLRCAR